MTIMWSEVKRGKKSLLILSFSLAAMLALCIALYPLIEMQMSMLEDMMGQMGSLGEMMEAESLMYATYIGYYGAECESLLGMGGMIYAAYLGASAVSKEIKMKSSEFLFSHPVSKTRILTEKILSSSLRIVILNVIIAIIALSVSAVMGEDFSVADFLLIHLALLIMQLEVLCLTFCVSSFFKSSGAGIGIAIGFGLYFLDVISALVEQVEFLKYITPFGYTHSMTIVADGGLDLVLIGLGILYGALALAASFILFKKRDLV